jgi:localization factor PodJL
MRHTIPWSVKGVDQDAREAAKEAARRSGMSLGEWLNAAIAEQAETAAHQETDTGLSTVTRRLDSIALRLDAVARRDQAPLAAPAGLVRTEHGDLVRALDAVARLAEISERRSAAAIEAVERLGSQTAQPRVAAPQLSPERSEAHARLDEIARSIRELEPSAAPRAAAAVSPPVPRPPVPQRARAIHHDIDATVAEIAARQRQLDSGMAAPPSAAAAPAGAPDRDLAPLAAKLDALGRQLDEVLRQPAQRQQPQADRTAIAGEISKLSARIEAFSKPADDGLERELKTLSGRIEQMRKDMAVRETNQSETALAELRADIAGLSEQLVDLAPRRAVETLETEIHAIADRLDEARAQGMSDAPLQKLVAEFERTVSRLMPAEGIAEEIRALSFRVDTLASNSFDTSLIERLTQETATVRAMLADAATRDAVDALAQQIGALGRRVEELAAPRPDGGAEALASAIEARIDEIATRLESASRAPAPAAPVAATSPELEDALRKLADKLDASHSRGNDPAALAEIERHILSLASKIDAADARFAQLGTIERGLSDLFVQMEEMRSSAIDAAERAARQAVVREAETRRDAGEPAVRRQQDSVEAVQNTLERVVKRIAEIEAPASAPDLTPAQPLATQPLEPTEARRAPSAPVPVVAERAAAPVSRQSAPTRPPGSVDLPLEPGSGAPRLRPPAPGATAGAGTKTDFIAAARRAAQAAAVEPAVRQEADESGKPSLLAKLRGAMRKAPKEAGEREPAVQAAEFRATRKSRQTTATVAPVVRDAAPEVLIEPAVDAPRPAGEADDKPKGRFAANRKTIVMGIAAALLVLAAGLSTLPRLRGGPPADDTTRSITVAPQGRSNAGSPATAADQPRAVPTTTFAPASATSAPAELPPVEPPATGVPAATPETAPETTGSVQRAQPSGTTVSPTGWQPVDSRTGRAISIPESLRAAADAGDPVAAHEMGTRYLEGRGVAASAAEAAKWYQRAADAGIPLAQYRLGSLYEKGTGVLRDFERARRLYERAAEAGNGKAMHNLAVMFAQGQASERPDYRTAAQWFRKAAEHGVSDSQYNLGILYARGLGVDQSIAESYKWFALAAAGGDQDAGKKRDEVAARLDAQTLVAARLAVQTFAAKPEPEAAVRVAAPAGGWGDPPAAEAPSAPAQPVRPAARRAQSQTR